MVVMLSNFLTNPTLSNIAQSTTMSVSIETGMKAAGRPAFILTDKKTDKSAKNYAAVKEFLYQITCLGVYMAIVIPVFKNGAFALAKKAFKDEKAFSYFGNAKSYLEYLKLSKMEKAKRISVIEKKENKLKLSDQIKNNLHKQDKLEEYSIIKGVIELGNIIGCVVGLAVISPKVSHYVVHPALKLLGLDKSKQNQPASATEIAELTKSKDNNLNVKA